MIYSKNALLITGITISSLLIASCSQTGNNTAPPSKQQERSAQGDLLIQEAEKVPNWFTKGPEEGVEGVNAEKAYRELDIQIGVEPVIVAVIDSGIDAQHEDLKANLWANPGEIPGNHVDDDGNGYVDDVHGWNFLGGYTADGRVANVNDATLEVTREMIRLKRVQSGRALTTAEQALLNKVSLEVLEARDQAQNLLDSNAAIRDAAFPEYQALRSVLNVQLADLTKQQVEQLVLTGARQQRARAARLKLLGLFEQYRLTGMARVFGRISYAEAQLNSYYNDTFFPREGVVAGSVDDMDFRDYGNHDAEGPDAGHGTHVAGIIGAVRGNGVGIDGIATDVRLMSLRAVPNGDEYDADVANAVRYAVDHGAKIINMSFGKAYSPQKAGVDAAFRYAAEKGVLVVHASGNDNRDVGARLSFPNRVTTDAQTLSNWLVIGASAAIANESLPAVFSNFSRTQVDLFSPGFRITSTVPEANEYDTYSGTSMATPAVSGVAALVWSQYPELSALEVKRALVESVRTYPGLVVKKPGTQDKVTFSSLSITGGVVDAYRALLKAKDIYHRLP